jgi:spore coat polysaccharide biosynthesis predicted glycosyltransferase SpsG
MRAVLRVDGGVTMGMGHLVRIQALGAALRRRGWDCTLLTAADGPFDFPRASIDRDASPQREHEELARLAPQVVIADLYRPTPDRLRAMAGDWKLVFVDDESPIAFDCDLLINPSLDPGFIHQKSERTRYLMGSEVILLRDQFQRLSAHATRPKATRLLVCFGGSDPVGMTVQVVTWLKAALPEVEHIDVVIGRGFSAHDQLESIEDGRVTVLRDRHDMAALFAEADVGVLAAGTLLYEAAAAGLPTLFVSITLAQAREAAAACEQGAGIHLGFYRDVSREQLVERLAALCTGSTRAALSASAQRLVDGFGCERAAQAIEALVP